VVTFEELERPMPKMQWLSFNLMIMTSFRTTVAIMSKMRWSSTTMQVHSLVLGDDKSTKAAFENPKNNG
jgi:hypothetical protein